ncbi:MAG: ion transporter, partial [Gammaproteobacteria bacterium]
MDTPASLRERLYIIVFQTDTDAGRRFDKILLLIILASLVTVILDSIDEIHQGYAGLLAAIEWGFTAIFLAEYLTRLYCSPKPLRYAFSFYGLVDLCTDSSTCCSSPSSSASRFTSRARSRA